MWDTRTWEQVGRFTENDHLIHSVCLSPDGRLVAFTSDVGKDIHLLDVTSGKLLRTLHAHTTGIRAAVFSPDGKIIASAGLDEADDAERVKFWDVESGKELAHTPKWRMGSKPLAFSPTGDILAVTMEDGSVRLLDGKKGEENRRLMPPDPKLNHPTGLTFSSDGRFLAIGERMGNNQVTVWDMREGKPLWQLKWPVPRDPRFIGERVYLPPDRNYHPGIYNLAFAADSRSLVVACNDGVIRVWELSTGGLRYKVAESAIFMAAASKISLIATSQGTHQESPHINMWDFRTSMPPRRPSTAAAVEKLWTNLDTRDAAGAFEHMRDLVAMPKEAIAILDKRLSTVDSVKAAVLDGLLRDLDDGSFEVRDRARRRLEELGELAKPALTKALAGMPSAEARNRIKELLDALESLPSEDRLRVLRAVEVLEMIGSPEARSVLKRLAGGASEAALTRQAKAALERLDAN